MEVAREIARCRQARVEEAAELRRGRADKRDHDGDYDDRDKTSAAHTDTLNGFNPYCKGFSSACTPSGNG